MSQQNDSQAYLDKKQSLSSTLTIFGRKPVLEALQNNALSFQRLHLADSNKLGGTLKDILNLATKLNIEIRYHSRQALARISKNGKQDQGVALDIQLSGFADYKSHLAQKAPHALSGNYIALDNITNPQNLGMIIRTVCASPCKAIIMPRKGCAKLDALVIKASAGTLFKADILWCDSLTDALHDFARAGACVTGLSLQTDTTIWDYTPPDSSVFVFGNETEGLRSEVAECCQQLIKIPMENAVESLNVAVSSGIIAFGMTPSPK